MNTEWSRRLSAGYYAAKGHKRAVRLPSDASFTVSGDGDTAHLHLPMSAVIGNMQSNAGAFESWCLALRRWCDARVSLSWELPGDRGNLHYERFLYRLQRFDSLFGDDWFSYADQTGALARSKVNLNSGNCQSASKRDPLSACKRDPLMGFRIAVTSAPFAGVGA